MSQTKIIQNSFKDKAKNVTEKGNPEIAKILELKSIKNHSNSKFLISF